jgi:hypothetical protein
MKTQGYLAASAIFAAPQSKVFAGETKAVDNVVSGMK